MNEIEIEGKRFAIENDLDMEHYSPFIDGQEIVLTGETINPRGTFTMMFTVIGTPELAAILQHPQLLQQRDRVRTFRNCVLRSNGVRIEAGSIDIYRLPQNLNSRHWKVEMQFYGESATYTDLIGETSLKDLYIHDDILVFGTTVRALLQDIQDGVGSSNFFTNGLPTTTINLDNGELYSEGGSNAWRWVFDNPDDQYMLGTSWYADQISQGIDPFDTAQASAPGLGFFCFPCYYADYEDSNLDTMHGMLNHYSYDKAFKYWSVKQQLHTIGEDWVKYVPGRNHIVPMYYYHVVLKACFSKLGYTVTGELFNDADFMKLVLPNTYSILREDVLAVENLWGTNTDIQYILYAQDFTTMQSKNHLSDIKVIDFLRDFMLKFNVYFKFNGKQVIVLGNTLERPAVQHTAVDPEVVAELKDTGGVTVKYNFDSTDTTYDKLIKYRNDVPVDLPEALADTDSDIYPDGQQYIKSAFGVIRTKNASLPLGYDNEVSNLVPYVTGKKKVLESEVTPVVMKEVDYVSTSDPGSTSTHKAYLPTFGHKITNYSLRLVMLRWESFDFGDSNQHKFVYLGTEEFELIEGDEEKKIAFYHGIQETLDSADIDYGYPYMSAHDYAPLNAGERTQLANWHLGWVGSRGLVKTFWRDWVNVFSGWSITFLIELTWEQVKQNNWSSSVIIRSSKYYISNIKFRLPAFLNRNKATVQAIEI